MKVINVMLGRGLGGIEFVSVQFARALAMRGHEVLMVIRNGAAIEPHVQALADESPLVSYQDLRVLGDYDLWARRKAGEIIAGFAADAVIARGNRAVRIFKSPAKKRGVPLIAGTPNYRFDSLLGLPGIVATTDDLRHAIIDAGHPSQQIWVLPNTLQANDFPPVDRAGLQSPPVIGAMGRLVEKKGFDLFLQALGQLHQQGIEFRALLGGSGEEQASLLALCNGLGLAGQVEFTGWVDDRAQFFQQLDLFVIPSRHEPFGIIMLEAFAAQLPVVSTAAEGPREIGSHEDDCLLVPVDDPEALANALRRLLTDPTMALGLAKNARDKVLAEYDLPVFADRLEQIVETVVRGNGQAAAD